MRLVRTLLFDLDGSLHNSEPIARRANDLAFRKAVGRALSVSEHRALVGKPAPEVFEAWFPGAGQAIFATVMAQYRKLQHLIVPFDGVPCMLKDLKTIGFTMAVVTTKLKPIATWELRNTGLLRYFDLVIGQEDTRKHKPHPEPLLRAASELDVVPATCLYSGDQPTDIQAARAANMTSAGLLWGEGRHETLAHACPTYLFATPNDLLQEAARGFSAC